jgi:hypothetical protein
MPTYGHKANIFRQGAEKCKATLATARATCAREEIWIEKSAAQKESRPVRPA